VCPSRVAPFPFVPLLARLKAAALSKDHFLDRRGDSAFTVAAR
jgi:hypothetical protein